MNNIEFRAWDGHCMDYEPRLDCSCADDCYGLGVGINKGFQITNLDFMLYTGLKDKFGTKIFEGDVVLLDNEKWLVAKNLKYLSMGLVDLPLQEEWFDYILARNHKRMEVIGNKFEDKKLI